MQNDVQNSNLSFMNILTILALCVIDRQKGKLSTVSLSSMPKYADEKFANKDCKYCYFVQSAAGELPYCGLFGSTVYMPCQDCKYFEMRTNTNEIKIVGSNYEI